MSDWLNGGDWRGGGGGASQFVGCFTYKFTGGLTDGRLCGAKDGWIDWMWRACDFPFGGCDKNKTHSHEDGVTIQTETSILIFLKLCTHRLHPTDEPSISLFCVIHRQHTHQVVVSRRGVPDSEINLYAPFCCKLKCVAVKCLKHAWAADFNDNSDTFYWVEWHAVAFIVAW